jgi:hypothetical protein
LERRTVIVERFVALVKSDRKLQASDGLSNQAIVDHLPQLLESFARDLHQAGGTQRSYKTAQEARAHGHIRWTQQYRLDEVLREFSVLRYVLMLQMADFERQRSFETVDRLIAERTLHSLIDEVMIVAATEFTSHFKSAGQLKERQSELAKAL